MAELTDLPEEDYFANPRLSQSQAKTLLANPARYKYELTAPREERATFDVGHAAHTLILGTGAPLAVIDVDSRRGKAWTDPADTARADGYVPLTRKEADAVHGMRDAVYDHPGARALLELDGQSEKTVLWDDEDVPCRARLDRLSDGLILDVKTAADASPAGFAKSAANYGYDVQQVAYTRAVQAATGEAPPFVFLVVEKAPPYSVALYTLPPEATERGERRWLDALDLFKQCTATDTWPAYGDDVQTLPWPRWAA